MCKTNVKCCNTLIQQKLNATIIYIFSPPLFFISKCNKEKINNSYTVLEFTVK